MQWLRYIRISDGGGRISAEHILEDDVFNQESHTYYINNNYAPSDDTSKSESMILETKDGKAMVEKLRTEQQDDVAPFIDFVPIFE